MVVSGAAEAILIMLIAVLALGLEPASGDALLSVLVVKLVLEKKEKFLKKKRKRTGGKQMTALCHRL